MKFRLVAKKSLLLASMLMLFAILTNPVIAQRYLIDFGLSATDDNGNGPGQGFDTPAGPDINGNHWNNFSAPSAAIAISGTTLSSLIDDTGLTSGIGLETFAAPGGGQFGSNGLNNGALSAAASHATARDPDPIIFDAGSAQFSLRPAADYAIPTVTGDYWFTGSTTGAGVKITGLNPSASYDLDLFGSRATTFYQVTRYTATGANGSFVQDLFTSGGETDGSFGIGSDGLYTGNDQYVVNLNGIEPTASGEIELVVSQGEFQGSPLGGFFYLGALGIHANVPGDFDGDSDVDGADFLEWQRSDGTSSGLSDWQSNYGNSSVAIGVINAPASLVAAVSVPEPGTTLLLSFGLLALGTSSLPRHRN